MARFAFLLVTLFVVALVGAEEEKPYNILLIGGGSRGDVQPVVALGSYLHKVHGFDCTIVAGPEFEDLSRSVGCEAANLHVNFEDTMQENKQIHQAILSEDVMRIFEIFGEVLSDPEIKSAKLLYKLLSEGNFDAALATSAELHAPITIAEKFGIPSFDLFLQPVWFDPNEVTGFFDPTMFDEIDPAANFEMWKGVWKMFCKDMLDKTINRGRKEVFGLEREFIYRDLYALVSGSHPAVETLYGFSGAIAAPSDVVDVTLHGYLYQMEMESDHSWFGVSEEMVEFFESGPAPVYIGWGSMCCGLENTPRITKVAVEALRKAGKRGVILKGWQKLSIEAIEDDADLYAYAKENVFFIDRAEHNWILPRCEAVMVHGGAGTTAQALKSGRPIIVSPYLADQPWWGHHVFQAGIGEMVSNFVQVTGDELGDAIISVTTNETMKERAKEVAAVVRAENGAENFAQTIIKKIQKYRSDGPAEIDWDVLQTFDYSWIGLDLGNIDDDIPHTKTKEENAVEDCEQ